ncbi:hypothetical protein ZIOFF_023948 [Zingiber officinale]|uniref:Leucine-rich repeat-containing N-terminal plant-type domain-containing protein n=1 Tax=Zingiber officinale TaxID=94328 RepID=A0A8J5LD66_ZINOF|nr:hypothetical protein ZIOFF_023948 [Zingiber officinale]
MTHLEIKEDNGNSVETLKEARQEPCSKKESSMSQKFVSGLVVDEDTDEIGGNSMNRKETGVMLYEEHNNAKAGGAFSQDYNEFRANQLPGEDHKYDEMPQAVHDPCLLKKSMKQTMLQGGKEVSRNEKMERILANPANPDVSASSDILNIDSDARGSLLFKDLDAHPENDDDLELQLAKDAAHIDNVGPSKFTSNFKKTEDNESGRMEKDICNTWDVAVTIDDEIAALLAIKSGLVDPLHSLSDWIPPENLEDDFFHCNWTGVECNSLGFVSALNLSRLNLSGVIADDLRRLSSLTTLNLCCNSFSSSLSISLSGLSSLREFDVSANAFVGEFPNGLGSSKGLTILNASSNNFVGSLPEDLSNATALQVLDFRGSFFEGSIPTAYRSLRNLKFLGLSGNNLTGKIPAELSELTSLEKLIIGYNELEGSIPAEFGNLSNLQYLDLAVGNLNDGIPPELGKLKQLTTLFLYKNNLDGEIRNWEYLGTHVARPL